MKNIISILRQLRSIITISMCHLLHHGRYKCVYRVKWSWVFVFLAHVDNDSNYCSRIFSTCVFVNQLLSWCLIESLRMKSTLRIFKVDRSRCRQFYVFYTIFCWIDRELDKYFSSSPLVIHQKCSPSN